MAFLFRPSVRRQVVGLEYFLFTLQEEDIKGRLCNSDSVFHMKSVSILVTWYPYLLSLTNSVCHGNCVALFPC